MTLFGEGLIQGLQLRVAHPIYTPSIAAADLPRVLAALPDGMRYIVHYGAENTGVDFGQCFDELGIYRKHASEEMTWGRWNRESIDWGIAVAQQLPIVPEHPLGVAHVGYGQLPAHAQTKGKIIHFLGQYFNQRVIALENVPAMTSLDGGRNFDFWGFGGTPEDMGDILENCGLKCLVDFTHLAVTVNQARGSCFRQHLPLMGMEETVRRYLDLPHWPICHFSGLPPVDWLVDTHDFTHISPPSFLRDAIRTMDTICLEIPWRAETARQQIETFRKFYGD